MKVWELLRKLEQLDPHLDVYREGGEYNGDWRRLQKVDQKRQNLGNYAGVFLS